MSIYQDQLNVGFSKVCEVHGIDSLRDVQEFCLRHLVETNHDNAIVVIRARTDQ